MKKNLRRVYITVTPQTAYHLQEMAAASGYRDPGPIVDKLVRDHQRDKNKKAKERKYHGIF